MVERGENLFMWPQQIHTKMKYIYSLMDLVCWKFHWLKFLDLLAVPARLVHRERAARSCQLLKLAQCNTGKTAGAGPVELGAEDAICIQWSKGEGRGKGALDVKYSMLNLNVVLHNIWNFILHNMPGHCTVSGPLKDFMYKTTDLRKS